MMKFSIKQNQNNNNINKIVGKKFTVTSINQITFIGTIINEHRNFNVMKFSTPIYPTQFIFGAQKTLEHFILLEFRKKPL